MGDPTDLLEDIHAFYPQWVENTMGAVGLICLITCPISTITALVLMFKA